MLRLPSPRPQVARNSQGITIGVTAVLFWLAFMVVMAAVSLVDILEGLLNG